MSVFFPVAKVQVVEYQTEVLIIRFTELQQKFKIQIPPSQGVGDYSKSSD